MISHETGRKFRTIHPMLQDFYASFSFKVPEVTVLNIFGDFRDDFLLKNMRLEQLAFLLYLLDFH